MIVSVIIFSFRRSTRICDLNVHDLDKFGLCPDGVIDVYHRRNGSEGINSYMKEHLGLETHINGKGTKNIDLHVTHCCIALLAVAMTRLQNGIIENIASVAYLT